MINSFPNFLSSIFGMAVGLAYIALIVFIIWQVISALRRITRAVEDIAQTFRRMESPGQQPSQHL